MKIGILTYYGVHNHGAVLQANALKSVLEAQGHEVKFLTFNRSYEYIPAEQTKKYKISPASIGFYAKYMTQKGVGNIVYNLEKSKTLKEYRQTHFDLSTPYDRFDGDAIIIGSDEVFNGLGLNCNKVLSYAGSFGPTTIEDVDRLAKREKITKGLSGMAAISVRDQNSQSVVKELTGKDVPLVCDPVILYGYSKEMGKKHDSEYILVYAYDGRMNDPDEVQKIKAFAKAHYKKLYSVGYHHKWCDRNVNVSPDQLLQLINNASFVITDTFHGSVMSIICNTPMAVKLRDNSNKLRYLMSEYGLEDQIVDDFGDLDRAAANKIDFNEVNQKVLERRRFSMNYLVNALRK